MFRSLLKWILPLMLIVSASIANAQEKGQLSGELFTNTNIYDNDSLIGTNTTQYKQELSSTEAWLLINYRYQGFHIQTRFDMFHNSPLLNPQEAYTQQGIGFYSISKTIDKWDFTVGHFYDQFGSGIIYRSFEERALGLDYATQGLRVRWAPNDSFMIKAFTGKQKFRFDVYPQVIKGINSEKIWGIGPLSMMSGFGFINRTLDDNTMDELAALINAKHWTERFQPYRNVYTASIYNRFALGPFNLYVEYAKKSKEANFIELPNRTFDLQNNDGEVFYSNLGFSKSGIGVNLQYRNVRSYIFRTTPFSQLNQGLITFIPPLAKQNSYRLPARYSIFGRDQGEKGFQGDVTFSPNSKNSFTLNGSYILRPDNYRLYRELYLDYIRKFNKNVRGQVGVQTLFYDQETYLGKVQKPAIKTFTPFTEWSFRLDKKRRKSLRVEAQYLFTEEDTRDLAWALVEFNWAPHYSISISDMVNTRPNPGEQVIHYYTIFGAYTYNQTRLTAGYIKQLEGVVCTGGVCRIEPAFSGFRFGLNTNF